MTWRQEISPLIRRVLEDTRDLPYLTRRHRARQAYHAAAPDGTPYQWRIWLDEVRRQLGQKKKRKGLPEREGAQRRLF